jgi:hypothetical protein
MNPTNAGGNCNVTGSKTIGGGMAATLTILRAGVKVVKIAKNPKFQAPNPKEVPNTKFKGPKRADSACGAGFATLRRHRGLRTFVPGATS